VVKKKEVTNLQNTNMLNVLSMKIGLVTAIVALITAAISLGKSIDNSRGYVFLQEEINNKVTDCRGKVAIEIKSPKSRSHSSSSVDVEGESTVHDICRYIFIFAREVSKPNGGWKVLDMTQLNKGGEWAGRVDLEGFANVGSEIDIDARVIANPDAFILNSYLKSPSEKGVPSNIVRIRRVQ